MEDHVFPRCLSIQMVRRKQLVTIRRADGLSVLNVRKPELQFLDFWLGAASVRTDGGVLHDYDTVRLIY